MAEQSTTLRTVLDDLVTQNLLQPEAQAQIARAVTRTSEPAPTPWFVSALIAISAWISVIPFITFLVLLKVLDSASSLIIVGLLLIIGTSLLHYFKKNSLFLKQLALALNLTGQVLFIVGIGSETDIETAALTTWFLEIVLISFYRDSILRFISVLIATVAALVLLERFSIHPGIHVLIVLLAVGVVWYWIVEARHLTDEMMKTLYQPLGYSFVVALQMVLLLSILPEVEFIPSTHWWYSTVGLTGILLALEYHLLHTNEIMIFSPQSYAIFAATVLMGILLYQSPGIIAAIIILLLGFQRGNRVLMGLALVFLTVFLSSYYYYLNITLLMKSITLISAGLMLLGLRLIMRHLSSISVAVEGNDPLGREIR